MKKLTLAAALLPTLLGGCIKFAADPPPSLLTLKASAALAPGDTQKAGRSVTILVPVVPAEIASQRVPVHSTDTSIAYLKDAVWVEAPNRQFARLLSDTVAARTGRLVLSVRQSLTDPGAMLSGELRNFGVYAGTNEVVVTFDGSLKRDGADGYEKRRFEARAPVTVVEPGAVGIALNQAANQVAGEVADWIGK